MTPTPLPPGQAGYIPRADLPAPRQAPPRPADRPLRDDDDQARVEVLRAALTDALAALDLTIEVLTGRAVLGGLAPRVNAARHGARVALSLDRGEA